MLARSSKYFYALFSGIGKGRKDIIISDISGDSFSNILNYIYTHHLCITEENLCDLLIAADYLLLDELVMDIRRQLSCHLSVSNCLFLFVIAMRINHSDILRETLRFIQMHFEIIVQDVNSGFCELPLEALKKVLSDKNLRLRSENTVWLAIVKWIEAENANRQSEVPDLLIYLTIRDVDEPLASGILNHSIVADNPFCNEIRGMKMSNSFTTNFGILFHYFWNHPHPALPLYRLRQPTHLNFIVYYCLLYDHDLVQIYVTYDENIDFWRKIIGIDYRFPFPYIRSIRPKFLVSVGSNIYVFRTKGNLCYNQVDKEWIQMTNSRLQWNEVVVKLEGLIYVISSTSLLPDEDTNTVKVYDSERNEWSEAAPMIPVSSFSAVALNKYIYVIGTTPIPIGTTSVGMDFPMVAQVYDQETDTWLLLPSPPIFRFGFAVVVYHGRIFVIGGESDKAGVKAVEVFDPSKGEWATVKELPYSYNEPKAIVLCDNLIVYDNCVEAVRSSLKINSPVQWNYGLECWIPVEPSSPLHDLHRYEFVTSDSPECISIISRENRNPETTFVKSPFN